MSDTESKPKRPSKKTDMLEVRVSPEEKAAFLEACRKVGRSASAVIRDAMRAYANFGPMARLPGSPIMIASAFAGAALGAWVLVSMTNGAHPESEERLYGMGEFVRLDLNADRQLTFEEMREAEGSARQILTLERSEQHRLSLAAQNGRLAGTLFGHDLDAMRFAQHPDTISEACWTAVEAYYEADRAVQFRLRDRDTNGMVTPSEYSHIALARLRYQFDSHDRGGDGVMTPADEHAPYPTRTREEMQAVFGSRPTDLFDLSAACAIEQGLPPVLVDRSAERTEDLQTRIRDAEAAARTIQDFDRDGEVTFEEFVAAREGYG